MKRSFILIFVLMMAIGFATSKTINPDGSGDWTSFTECFTALVTNGITGPLDVEVAAGTYVEAAALDGAIPGASADSWVHIYPAGGEVIVDGGWDAWAIGITNTSWVHLDGLNLQMDISNEFSNGALYVGGSTNIDISHCRIHQSGFVGALISQSSSVRFWNNFIYDTAAASLSVAMCGADANIEIWNNSFYYNYPDFGGFFGQPAQCLALTESSANVHNNAFHKDVNDVMDGGPMDSSRGIVNIEFYGGDMASFFTGSSFDNNCYYTEPGTKLFQVGFAEYYTDLSDLNTAYGFESAGVNGDIMYDDAANGDLNISSAESACYMAGAVPARWFSDDINYETREHWDIGADFIPTPTLSGTVTVDPSGTGDYSSFGELFTALVTNGITGPLDVEVAAGTYVEAAALDGAIPGASADSWVHIYPAGGEVIVDGGWDAWAIGITNTSWVHLDGLNLQMDISNEFSNGALYVGGSTNIDISHCRIHQSGFVGALISQSSSVRFWNNFIYDTAAASLSVAMCGADANIEIWNNSFYYNYPDFGGFFGQPAQCLALTESSANVHNNAFHKDVNDVMDGGPMDSSRGIVNIEFYGGDMASFFTGSSFDNNCYYTEPGTKLFQVGFAEYYTDLSDLNTAYGFESAGVNGDIMYDDAANGDLNISSAESACYMAGAVPARWFSDDINYETREHWDIGADFIPGTTLVLTPPSNLQYSVQQETNVNLTWDAPQGSDGTLLGYNVYRDASQINGSLITELLYLDEGLTDGIYSYSVTAVYEEGESDPSDPVEVVIVVTPANGDITRIDIPWILSASSDGYMLVGGVEGDGGGLYWIPDGGISTIPNTGGASDVSDNGYIAGQAFNNDGDLEATMWDVESLTPNLLGTVEGGTPMSGELNTVNAISDDGSTVVGLAWYNLGMGSAKAYKWTPETGSILLPDVDNWSDSRADCVSSDGGLIGGYAAQERSIWRPVLWNDTNLIELPYVLDDWSTVSALSPNGEWCSGYNGNKGIVWQNQEIADIVGEDDAMIQTKFRTMTDDGWTGGETANWNTMHSDPVIWNTQDGLMNAVDYFQSHGVVIPEDYELFRVRWMSNDHLTFVCNGTNLNNYQYQSSIVRLPGAHGVSNFKLAVENDTNVHATWYFDEEFSPAESIVLLRNGVQIATLPPETNDYLDEDLSLGDYVYEIYVTYAQYDNSVSRVKSIAVDLSTCLGDGDSNLDGNVDVTDVVFSVSYILGTTEFNEINFCHADMNYDSSVDIIDVVAMIDAILGNGRETGAKTARLIRDENSLSLRADGLVDAVEIHISHKDDIALTLNPDALVADYSTDGNHSTIILVEPQGELLFTADGPFEVDRIEAASDNGYVEVEIIQSYTLLSNYPNPFNPETTINYSLPDDGPVSLTVYDLQGKLIETLTQGQQLAGEHSLNWNAGRYASGVYLLQLKGDNFQKTQKLMLMK